MKHEVLMTRNGIECKIGNVSICLDPRTVRPGLNFVSHAHCDHLPNGGGGGGGGGGRKVPASAKTHAPARSHRPAVAPPAPAVLASAETHAIAAKRGVAMQNPVTEFEDITLHDTGHILGARGLLCDGLFYTGDICTRNRGFLRGAKVPKCRTLITECTFGLPEFRDFPNPDEIQRRVNEIISGLYSKGVPVILMGYQLGKAQTITQLFQRDWDPFYLHDSVKEMNDLHREFGIGLRDAPGHTWAEGRGLLDRRPWVMVAPMMSEQKPFVKHMKSRYGAVTIGFTGWAKSAKFPFGRRCDYPIPLSDHCDFRELVDMVVRSGAEKVYTTHGFADEFAEYLRNGHGIDAQPLRVGEGSGSPQPPACAAAAGLTRSRRAGAPLAALSRS